MGIELPPELAPVAAAAGVAWPEADEDRMRESAQAWRDAAARMGALAGEADHAARDALNTIDGDTAEAARTHWSGFVQPDTGHLTSAARGCLAAADRLDRAAEQVGAAKVEIVRHLVDLARNSDAAHHAAAAGNPTALLGLDTAVRGTAVNVANITHTLVDAVHAGGPDIAATRDLVNANPGARAGLLDPQAQAGGPSQAVGSGLLGGPGGPGGLGGLLQPIAGAVGGPVAGVAQELAQVTGGTPHGLTGSASGVAGGAVQGVAGGPGGLAQGIADAVSGPGGLVQGVASAAGGAAQGVAGGTGDLAQGLAGTAGGAVQGVAGGVGGLAQGVVETAGGTVQGVAGGAGGLVQGVAGTADGALRGVAGSADGLVQGLAGTAGGAVQGVGGLVQGVAETAGGTVQGVVGGADGLVQGIAGTAGGAVQGVTGGAGGLTQGVVEVAGGAGGLVQGVDGAVQGGAGGLAQGVTGIAHGLTGEQAQGVAGQVPAGLHPDMGTGPIRLPMDAPTPPAGFPAPGPGTVHAAAAAVLDAPSALANQAPAPAAPQAGVAAGAPQAPLAGLPATGGPMGGPLPPPAAAVPGPRPQPGPLAAPLPGASGSPVGSPGSGSPGRAAGELPTAADKGAVSDKAGSSAGKAPVSPDKALPADKAVAADRALPAERTFFADRAAADRAAASGALPADRAATGGALPADKAGAAERAFSADKAVGADKAVSADKGVPANEAIAAERAAFPDQGPAPISATLDEPPSQDSAFVGFVAPVPPLLGQVPGQQAPGAQLPGGQQGSGGHQVPGNAPPPDLERISNLPGVFAGAQLPGGEARVERDSELAMFLLHLFPIGHLPVATKRPERQLPPPPEELDYAAGLRFEPGDHPEAHLVDTTTVVGRGRPGEGLPVDHLTEGYDPLGGRHERDWDRRFLVRPADPAAGVRAEYAWPPCEAHPEGGSAPGEPSVLEPGTLVDRFGGEEGRVLSADGTPFAARSLPPTHLGAGYRRYRVLRPLPVWRAVSAAWFAQRGGGERYRATHPVAELVALGYLVEEEER